MDVCPTELPEYSPSNTFQISATWIFPGLPPFPHLVPSPVPPIAWPCSFPDPSPPLPCHSRCPLRGHTPPKLPQGTGEGQHSPSFHAGAAYVYSLSTSLPARPSQPLLFSKGNMGSGQPVSLLASQYCGRRKAHRASLPSSRLPTFPRAGLSLSEARSLACSCFFCLSPRVPCTT